MLLFSQHRELFSSAGRVVVVEMDLFQLAEEDRSDSFPEGFRFSWIAFDSESPETRVLFDCHPPKGPHFHMDGDPEGTPFPWDSLDGAIQLFMEKMRDHFGELTPIPSLTERGKKK